MKVWLVVAILAVFCVGMGRAGLEFQVKVEPKAEDCFYRDYDAGAKVDFEWRVLDGGLLDIDVRVRRALSSLLSFMCVSCFISVP